MRILAIAALGVIAATATARESCAQFGPLPPPAQACLGPAALRNPHCHPHHIVTPPGKPPGPPMDLSNPRSRTSSATAVDPGNGGGNQRVLYDVGLGFLGCILGGHMLDTFRVHEVLKRKRTREDEQMVVANCVLPVLGGVLVHKAWEGKKPVLLPFYTRDDHPRYFAWAR